MDIVRARQIRSLLSVSLKWSELMWESKQVYQKCRACGYDNFLSRWSRLSIESSDGNAYLVCYEYDDRKDVMARISRGGVNLYAFPECRSVIWGK